MKQRGRKSEASREVASLTLESDRPEPPAELTDEQAEEWQAVVDRLPADWFQAEHYPVLADYCRHVCRARFVARVLDAFPAQELETDEGVRRFDKLSNAAERETRAVLACARSMRLTHQARYDEKTAFRGASNSPSGPKPWLDH
jgi:phage terminase small subunit